MKHRKNCRLVVSTVPSSKPRLSCRLKFIKRCLRSRIRIGRIASAVVHNKSRPLSRHIVSAVDNRQHPYTNVNIVTVGGNQIPISNSFASGKELLLKVAQSMMDPACVIRLCAGQQILNKAVLENDRCVMDKVNSNVLTVVVTKANPESGTIEAFDTIYGDDIPLGSYTREFKKIGHMYDPDDNLPKMPSILHNMLQNLTPGAPVVRCWGVNFPAQYMDLATCQQCTACTTFFGALLNNWCTADNWVVCNECINYEARVTAVCSRCECAIRDDDNHPNVRPQQATKPDFFLPSQFIVEYSELWCAYCSVNHSANFTGC